MFSLFKKAEAPKLDINQGYRNFENEPNKYVVLCVDEQKTYDEVHMRGAENLPLRVIEEEMPEFYPEKDVTYYVYAINPANSKKAGKKLVKLGYDVYDLGSFIDFNGREEGNHARRKRKRR